VQTKISVRHGHLGDDIQQHIYDKAQKLLHIFDRLTMIEITVDLGNKEHKRVEFLVQAEHKHDFVATETHTDLLAAVDLVLDKLGHQVRKYKEKIQEHRHAPKASDVAGIPYLEGGHGL